MEKDEEIRITMTERLHTRTQHTHNAKTETKTVALVALNYRSLVHQHKTERAKKN